MDEVKCFCYFEKYKLLESLHQLNSGIEHRYVDKCCCYLLVSNNLCLGLIPDFEAWTSIHNTIDCLAVDC